MDDSGGCLGYLILIAIGIAVIGFVIWLIMQIALYAGMAMGVAGVAYGGAQACKNYGHAFMHNVIESNRA